MCAARQYECCSSDDDDNRSRSCVGRRTAQVNASGFNAFQSPNFEPLVEVGVEIEVYWDRILLPPENAEYEAR